MYNRPFFLLFLLVGLKICGPTFIYGQNKEQDFGYSSTTDYYDARKYEKKTRTVLIGIYSKDPSETLMGNECVESYTRELGFEYVYPFSSPGVPRNDLYIFANNRWNGLRLIFKNGLFWKRRVKKRIKACRLSSGDYRG